MLDRSHAPEFLQRQPQQIEIDYQNMKVSDLFPDSTKKFLNDCITQKTFDKIKPQVLPAFIDYITTNHTLNDQREALGVKTRQAAKSKIVTEMGHLWQEFPPEIRLSHDRKNAFKLKVLHSPESRKKIGDAQRGVRTHSSKTKEKIREALKGRESPMKGRELTNDHKARISEGNLRRLARLEKERLLSTRGKLASISEEKVG